MIPITPDLQLLANIIGTMRSAVNRNSGVCDQKIGPQSGVQADIDGALGELAFAKWKNVWPDLSLSVRSGSYDCVVTGTRVDVKTTRYLNGRLTATLKQTADVDIYVLAIIDNDCVRFPGYLRASELRRDENIRDLGHGNTYCVEQEKLHKFAAFSSPH